MSRNKKMVLKIIFVLLLLAAVFYTFHGSAGEMLEQLRQTAPWVIAVILGLSVLYHLLEGWIILIFARKENPNFTYGQGIACAFYCAFYRVSTLGSGAGVAGVFYLQKSGIEVSNATGMYMIQYVWHKISIAIFCGICFLLDFSVMEERFGSYNWALLAGYLITIVICVVLTLTVCSKRFHRFLLWLMGKCNCRGKLDEKIELVKDKLRLLEEASVMLLKDKKLTIGVIGINQIKLLLWYLIPYVVLMGNGGSQTSVLDAVTITALSVMLAAVIPAPAGIGAVEFMIITLFGAVTDAGSAGAVAVLYRVATFVFPFLIGIIPAIRMGKAAQNKKNDK